MPTYYSIVNWTKYQHYKNRRPTWIKLYTDMLERYDGEGVPRSLYQADNASKLLAFMLLVLAAQTNNRIPDDQDWVRMKTGLEGDANFEPLVRIGFIERYQDASTNASDPLAERYQDASNSAIPEKRREESEKSKRRKTPQQPPFVAGLDAVKDDTPLDPPAEGMGDFLEAAAEENDLDRKIWSWINDARNACPGMTTTGAEIEIRHAVETHGEDWTRRKVSAAVAGGIRNLRQYIQGASSQQAGRQFANPKAATTPALTPEIQDQVLNEIFGKE